jgi:hypothetical protein
VDDSPLYRRRLENWHQTGDRRLPQARDAAASIARLGLVTHFPVTAELPNLFHAYTGSPETRVTSEHDGPSGEVYTWRWELGRIDAGFYTAIVRKRPTWVSWELLPAMLRLRGELRTVDEVFHAGELSPGAYRVAQALDEAGGVLATGDLRRLAGFPTGKEQRAAYLKAVEELDTRLMLAKAFSPDDEDMRHALVEVVHQPHLVAAEQLSRDEALDRFLVCYLPHAVYAAPAVLAKDLGVPSPELTAALERLVNDGKVRMEALPGYKGTCSVWIGQD